VIAVPSNTPLVRTLPAKCASRLDAVIVSAVSTTPLLLTITLIFLFDVV
jgi:hypothetical protein